MTVSALLLQVILPLIGTAVLGLVARWLHSSATAIDSGQRRDTVSWAMSEVLKKAAVVVARLEQTERPRLGQAAGDGKLTADEAKELAQQALLDLFKIAREEFGALLAQGVDQERIDLLARTAIEASVRKMKTP